MTAHNPLLPIVEGATALAQGRMTRLYDALCHAPSGGMDTSELAGRTGIQRRMAHRLLARMEGEGLVWSSLGHPPVERSRTGAVRYWRRTGAA